MKHVWPRLEARVALYFLVINMRTLPKKYSDMVFNGFYGHFSILRAELVDVSSPVQRLEFAKPSLSIHEENDKVSSFRGSGEWEDCGKETDQRTPCVPHRYKLAIFAAMGLVLVVGSRSCFSLVMTHVTSGANVSLAAEDVIFTDCTAINTSLDMNIDMGGDTMFLLHASYSAGLTVGKFPGSLLSTLFSPKRVISLSVLMTSVLTMVLPLAIPFSSPLLFLLRTTQGLVE
ncbi:hypothetical protein BaRGS_00009064, partial [Batillaria attramentaria]